MTTATATSSLAQSHGKGLPSRLALWLRWAVQHLAARAQRQAQRDLSETVRRDIAQVRRLAAQVRASQPGYANDLEAAATAFEAQATVR